MIILRLTTLDEYRGYVRTQISYMQRGFQLYMLDIEGRHYGGGWYPTEQQQDEFKTKADEINEWIRGQGIEYQTTPWRNFYSMPNKATAMQFKLTFC